MACRVGEIEWMDIEWFKSSHSFICSFTDFMITIENLLHAVPLSVTEHTQMNTKTPLLPEWNFIFSRPSQASKRQMGEYK
jgi:hypothetical protein